MTSFSFHRSPRLCYTSFIDLFILQTNLILSTMGNSNSSPSHQQQETARKVQEEQRTRGVLLPPSFLLNESLSIQDRLPLQPSLIDDLKVHDASNRILQDYMRPGVWIVAQDPVYPTRVATSIPLVLSNSVVSSSALLLLERQGDNNTLQLRVGNVNQINTTLTGSYSLWNNRCTLFGQVTPNGQGWAGTHLQYDMSSPDKPALLQLGTHFKGSLSLAESKCPFHSAPVVADQIMGYASMTFLGTTTAVETRVPLHPHQDLRQVQTRTYFNMNLSGDGEMDSGGPLQLTLENTPTSAALAVSQVIPWDRYQVNPLEDRAPMIRTTCAWTVRVEQTTTAATNVEPSATTTTIIPTTYTANNNNNNNPSLSMGAAWQINRGVGIKTIYTPSSGLTTALVLKRWKQPRVACSLLMQPQTGSLVGVSVELETGQLREAGYVPENLIMLPNNKVPETRTTLPVM
jgi:hypothetical protein